MKAFLDPAADYHMHTRYSDGCATVRETIEAAISKGFRRIAITDHMPLPFINRYAVKPDEVDAYREDIRRIRDDYADVIDVKMGLEMEYLSGLEAWTERIAGAGWEYAIGSVHGIIAGGRHGIVNGTQAEFEQLLNTLFNRDIRALCTCYYMQLRRVVASGLFTAVGHMDVLKKHNINHVYFNESEGWYRELVAETLDQIGASSMKVEINVSGYDHPVASPYPSPWIVAECIRRGITLVLSSDAHRPDSIGRNFEKLPDILNSATMQ